MKILHLCGGSLNSGATLGAAALHKGLLDLGVESKLIFSKGDKSESVPEAEPFFDSPVNRKLFDLSTKWIEPRILKRATQQKRPGLSIGRVGHPLFLKRKQIDAADIIHLHWINSRFLRIKAIRHFNKPIVWTIRDAWPYTGGCHYTNHCDRYKTGCGQCPIIQSSDSEDISRKVVNSKKTHLPDGICYVALSNWTATQALDSYLLKNESVKVILNNIDDLFFSPPAQTKEEARKQFNIPQGKVIILAGAAKLDSNYKGYSELLPKIPNIEGQNCHLVTFGRISKKLQSAIQIDATHLGSIEVTEQLRELYHASDIFIAPSIQEAFGKTLAEAGACGLPVVSYDTGGPKDIVLDGVTGYRVSVGDTDLLIEKTLKLAEESEKRKVMGRAAIKHTRKHFTPQIVAQQHIEIYQSLINNQKNNG